MKLGVLVAGSSGSLCMSLGLCSSFSFGIVSTFYSSDFDHHSNVQWIRNFKRS